MEIYVINQVELSDQVKKDMKKVPHFIVDKLLSWVRLVEKSGVEEVRKIKGYHDEPLKGDRKSQRSIRLSLSYRAIYIVKDNGTAEFISVEEVNKHVY